MFKDVSQARAMADALTHQATHDALTGLEDRAVFDKRLRQNVENARSFGEQHALLHLDLDQFKVANDSCGHAAGDELLNQLAQVTKIRSALDENRLVLFAQDIADAQGRDEGLHYEVLVRLRERDGRLLPPVSFYRRRNAST